MRAAFPSKKQLIVGIGSAMVAGGWLLANPWGRLGFCWYGVSVYSCRPHLLSDFQIRANGDLRKVEKTHGIQIETVRWLTSPGPTVLIIATGWHGVCKIAESVRSLPTGIDVRILRTADARRVYNALKKTGTRVAIHCHSTC